MTDYGTLLLTIGCILLLISIILPIIHKPLYNYAMEVFYDGTLVGEMMQVIVDPDDDYTPSDVLLAIFIYITLHIFILTIIFTVVVSVLIGLWIILPAALAIVLLMGLIYLIRIIKTKK